MHLRWGYDRTDFYYCCKHAAAKHQNSGIKKTKKFHLNEHGMMEWISQ